MSAALTIRVISDTATPAIERSRALLTGAAAKRAAGLGLRRQVRAHLRALPPNKNFPDVTTGYWKSAAESVSAPTVTPTGATISITQVGFRQRYYGGTITPTNAKLLTIPAREEAYGHRASEFNLKLVSFGMGPTGRPILALVDNNYFQAVKYRKTKKGVRLAWGPVTGGAVMFWLTPSVTQEANPGVLPDEEEMQLAALGGVRSYVRAKLHDPSASVDFTSGEAP